MFPSVRSRAQKLLINVRVCVCVLLGLSKPSMPPFVSSLCTLLIFPPLHTLTIKWVDYKTNPQGFFQLANSLYYIPMPYVGTSSVHNDSYDFGCQLHHIISMSVCVCVCVCVTGGHRK